MKTDDYTFVRVKRTYILNNSQAQKAVAVARALSANIKYHSKDAGGTELVVEGNDYLMEDGTIDVASAIDDIPDPESLLQIECVESISGSLSPSEIAKITSHWPKSWREERSGSDY